MKFPKLRFSFYMSLFIGVVLISNISRSETCSYGDAVFRTFDTISLEQCTEACDLRTRCKTASYRRLFHLCELLGEVEENVMNSQEKRKDCIFIKRSDINAQKYAQCHCSIGETCDLATKSCQTTECSKLYLEHGQIKGNMFSVGSQIKFTCNEGYVEDRGQIYSACDESGQWSHVPQCKREIAIGSTCLIDSDCPLTGGKCIQKKCLCGPLYRYQLETHDCTKVCTSFGATFVKLEGIRVAGHNDIAQKQPITSILECEDKCKTDRNCLSFEVWLHIKTSTLMCNRATITYEMMLDGDSKSLKNDSGVMYNRICS